MISFTPFPNFETENPILRRMTQNDVNDLFEIKKDPKMHECTDTKVKVSRLLYI